MMTLTKKLVLAFLAVTVLPFAALVWVLSIPAIRQSETFMGARLQDNVVQAAYFIDQFMVNCVRDMRSLVGDPQYLSSDEQAANQYLEEFTYSYPYFHRISFVDPSGRVIASSYKLIVGKPLFAVDDGARAEIDRAYASAAGTVFVSDFSASRTAAQPIETRDGESRIDLKLRLFAPVHDTDGRKVGVLVADLVTDQLADLLADVQRRLPVTNHVYLLDGSGRVLMSTDARARLLAAHPDAERTFKPSFQATSSGYLIYDSARGDRAMSGYSSLWTYGTEKGGFWRLVATAPYGEIMKPVVAGLQQAAAILLAALIAAAIFGVFLARVVARPILSLTEAAKQISTGHFDARAAVNSSDETGALAKAFNAMAGKIQSQLLALEDARDALERRVEERTRELRDEVAERQRSEQALRMSNQRFELVTRATSDIMWDWDLVRNTVWWNENYCIVFGYSPADVSEGAESWTERIHPDDRSAVLSSIHDVIDSGGTLWSAEYRFRRNDGSYAFIYDRGYVVRDDTGKAFRMMGAMQDISDRKKAETELETIHKQLLDASRRGGMAEIASNVLHNVGNVLNSVNVSVALITDRARKTKAANLAKVVQLLKDQGANLGAFITSDARGKHLPVYLAELSQQLQTEQKEALEELSTLCRNVDHIKEIVNMQQSYATVSGLREVLNPVMLVEDSLRMNAGALTRHGVTVVRDFEAVPSINVDKHRVLQILVNLVRNAKYACDESNREDKRLTLRIRNTGTHVSISVIDNGVGIPTENLTRIFNHGFTTRKGGHGFGLHSAALAANELGGSLTAHSDGVDQGAVFTLELPLEAQEKAA